MVGWLLPAEKRHRPALIVKLDRNLTHLFGRKYLKFLNGFPWGTLYALLRTIRESDFAPLLNLIAGLK